MTRPRPILSFSLILSILAGLFCLPATAGPVNATFHEGTAVVSHTRYLHGYPDGSFRPNDHLTRAEAAEVLYNLLDPSERPNSLVGYQPFSDVPLSSNQWYFFPVASLSVLGLLSGYEDGSFRPNHPLTRGELVVLLSRMVPTSEEGICPFSDVSVGHWAYQAISLASEQDWVTGYPDGSFRPDQTVTRTEAVVLLNRALDRYCDQDFVDSCDHLPSFSDVSPSFWGYYAVMEGVISHSCRIKEGKEIWTDVILGA